jgi:hypothetical protein
MDNTPETVDQTLARQPDTPRTSIPLHFQLSGMRPIEPIFIQLFPTGATLQFGFGGFWRHRER